MRIYLDNAATTWPKPEAVYAAVDQYQREVGAPNGRSGYRDALTASQLVEEAREGIARLIGVEDPRQVIFTASGTDSLNLAIRGVVRPGDHVVTTVCEHNSVLRPLRWLAETSDVSVSYVPCDGQGIVSPDDLDAAIRPETRLVAVIHASNVTGALQPIEAIASRVHKQGALFLVDAAQSLGVVPIDVTRLGIDLLAAPGHKGLLGPLGTGILAIRPGVERQLQPLRFGGTGTQSDEDRQPDVLPDKYEPGNHNLPGLAGLTAAIAFLEDQTVEIEQHHLELADLLLEGLQGIPGLHIHGPPIWANRTSVVSVTLEGYDPQELAAVLESSQGIQCRAGWHCAPKMHVALGTDRCGGTLRFSPGFTTRREDIEKVVTLFESLTAAVSHGMPQ